MIRVDKQNRPPWTGILATFLISLTFLSGCNGSASSRDSIEENAVVAVVNGENILAGKFKRELRLLKRKYRVQDRPSFKPGKLLLMKTKTLNQLVQNLLFEQEAKKKNIRVSEEEFQEALMKAKSGYGEDTFNQVFEKEDIDRQDWEKKMRTNLLIKSLLSNRVSSRVNIAEEELAEYFENHPREFHKSEQVRALHIMLATEEEARTILKRLETRNTKFSDLAKEYSQGPEGPEGGDLGYFEAGQMPEEFDSVFKLKTGKISDVIRTPYGFHILKVVDKKSARTMSLEESKKRIQTELLRQRQEEAFREWAQQIREQSKIEIHHENFAQIN